MNTDAIESMVRDVLSRMNSLQGEAPAAAPAAGGAPRSAKVSDYPLANKHPEWVKTATNKTLDDFTLENVLSNKVTAQDMPGNAALTGFYRQGRGPRPVGDELRTRRRTDRGTGRSHS